jgi:hypothetical protein
MLFPNNSTPINLLFSCFITFYFIYKERERRVYKNVVIKKQLRVNGFRDVFSYSNSLVVTVNFFLNSLLSLVKNLKIFIRTVNWLKITACEIQGIVIGINFPEEFFVSLPRFVEKKFINLCYGMDLALPTAPWLWGRLGI